MQVAATLTPSTKEHIAAAIIAAYRDLKGRDPLTKNSWLWPLALSANETADWKSMRNWNVGNVTAAHPDSVTWFYNPFVTSTALKFLSFDGPRAGALSMLKTLDHNGGLIAAETGDQVGWQNALNAYLGGDTYPPLWSIIARLQDTVPDGGFDGGYELVGPPAPRTPVLLVALAALTMTAAAAAAAHWRHEA